MRVYICLIRILCLLNSLCLCLYPYERRSLCPEMFKTTNARVYLDLDFAESKSHQIITRQTGTIQGHILKASQTYLAGITSQCKCRHFEKLHTDMYTCINDDVPRWEPCTFQVYIDTSSGDFEILYTSMTHIHNYINHHHSKVSSSASRIAITFSKALSRMYALFARSLGILLLIVYSETHS